MVKLIKNTNKFYTVISNDVIQDNKLSFKAKGIFLQLWSNSNGWQFYVSEIAKHATDGEASLRSGLKELEERGYLKRVHRQNEKGNFDGMDWILSDERMINHHSENTIDGENADVSGKVIENPSDGKTIQWENHPMGNCALINTNNNNYQYKQISNKINQPVGEDEEEIPYQNVIDYLNLKTGRLTDPIHQFKSTSKQNMKLIRDRWNEGYRLEQFKAVIDIKCAQWLGTEKEQFLKPKTLFSESHFDDYLNQKPDDKFYIKAGKKRKEIATDWSKFQTTDNTIDLNQLSKDFDEIEDQQWKHGTD